MWLWRSNDDNKVQIIANRGSDIGLVSSAALCNDIIINQRVEDDLSYKTSPFHVM